MALTPNQTKIIELEDQRTVLRQQLIELTKDVEGVESLLTQISALDEKIEGLKVSGSPELWLKK